jgi:hypothetical protein
MTAARGTPAAVSSSAVIHPDRCDPLVQWYRNGRP